MKLALAIFKIAIVALLLTAPIVARAAESERVVRLNTDLGPENVLVQQPAHPHATLVMLPGGDGKIGLQNTGTIRDKDNFVVRTRGYWLQKGFAVVVPDSPGNHDLRGLRQKPSFASVVIGLVHLAHEQVNGPVFLVSTSQGTIAAVNGAAHAEQGAIAGIVLTETISKPGRLSQSTVFDADPSGVRSPVLIVANKDDACPVATPSMALRIAQAMTISSSVEVQVVGGGKLDGKPCVSASAHGYWGIAPKVDATICSWIGRQLRL